MPKRKRNNNLLPQPQEILKEGVLLKSLKGTDILPRNNTQIKIVDSIHTNDITIVSGPAGSGKSYIAVVMAVKYLLEGKVNRIILTRPVVEAGEKLGFLPGSLKEKLDPYLRPLFDILTELIPPPKLKEFVDSNIIELCPLAYMRGRTFPNAFIILDEAQNTSEQQLKMFLTRVGIQSKVVITGDLTQIDLPKSIPSGLITLVTILKDLKGVDIIFTTESDIVRHPLIAQILKRFSNILA